MSKITDKQIVDECLASNPKNLYLFLDRYKYYVISKNKKDNVELEDVWVEVCYMIYDKIRKGYYNDDYRLSTWVITIIKNYNSGYYRKLKTLRKRLPTVGLDEPITDDLSLHDILKCDNNNGLDALINEENNEYLMDEKVRLLNKVWNLPRRFSVTLDMKYYQGASNEEISEKLNISMCVVRYNIYRGRLLLKRRYGGVNPIKTI